MPKSTGAKHHYIPVFYLKQWTGDDDRLCEYSRPYKIVKPRRVHPDGTGYIRDLYTMRDMPPHDADALERKFLQTTDEWAARAFRLLLSNRMSEFDARTRSGWSRFILSLLLRNPEHVRTAAHDVSTILAEGVDEAARKYLEDRKPDDPPTLQEYIEKNHPHMTGAYTISHLAQLIDSPKIGQVINNMRWCVLRVEDDKYNLLTSDRPVIMTIGLHRPESHIAMPMSPTQLFVAYRSPEVERKIMNVIPRPLIADVNDAVARQARRFVYGTDDSQLLFVSRRLGTAPAGSVIESLIGIRG